MMGKALNVMSLAVALVAVGTLLTLLLVIFHRRITLRQINEHAGSNYPNRLPK